MGGQANIAPAIPELPISSDSKATCCRSPHDMCRELATVGGHRDQRRKEDDLDCCSRCQLRSRTA